MLSLECTQYECSSRIPCAWANWLNTLATWDILTTFTFADRTVGVGQAWRKLDDWTYVQNFYGLDHGDSRTSVPLVVSMEPHAYGHTPHFHLLMSSFTFTDLASWHWGWSKTRQVGRSLAANLYVVKYAIKDISDQRISDNLRFYGLDKC